MIFLFEKTSFQVLVDESEGWEGRFLAAAPGSIIGEGWGYCAIPLRVVETNRSVRIHTAHYPVAATVSYEPSREITGRFRLSAGRYICLPTTFEPGKEGEFLLRFVCTSGSGAEADSSASTIRIAPLGKEGFSGVIDTFRGAFLGYPVGVVRIEIIACRDLARRRRMGADAACYVEIGFHDGRRRRAQSDAQNPDASIAPAAEYHRSLDALTITDADASTYTATTTHADLRPTTILAWDPPLDSRSGQSFKTPAIRGADPEFAAAFMFPVRRPATATIDIAVRGRELFRDRFLGGARVCVGDYLDDGMRDRMWEVEMPLRPREDGGRDVVQGFINLRVKYESGVGAL
ncbi:hypothetical protein BDK51DRAFT_48772 [Blyttiomyces helicus]|uniref:Peptidase C2 calpain domain-containing protein n=1 Tax=Blyttiomyces helicus TaxID=388810 RepID=A0A4V1IRF7_9FUNG|nr:hypothetical protein BDK51DRAFT_48772 [Blyttiomyces helicus]|eukprot:RKO89897.1 hypothetical protein BDK51DRAFT_48772 [Blyttiomyces helicus]